MDDTYLFFSPYQIKEFGGNFYNGQDYSYRTQETNRFKILKNIYIPFGPVCKNFKGLEKFLQKIGKHRFAKIKIDLPLILDEKIKEYVIQELINHGYNEGSYIQDDETILINKENLTLVKHIQNNTKRALKAYRVEIKSNITDDEMSQIYNIYLELAKKIGFSPKSIKAFKALSRHSLFALGYSIESNKIGGFILGYKANLFKEDKKKKVLQIIFTAVDENARKEKLGYAIHQKLFEEAFENFDIDYIDFHGASRSKGRNYTEFKEYFGGEFLSHGGSFEKLNLI